MIHAESPRFLFGPGPFSSACRWLWQLEFVPPAWRESLAFALRSWLASVLALYAAFYLQLEAPYWAGMAIWMVAQPTPGMAISKSYYRIVGTLIGSAMGVVLLIFFAQTPELFIAVLALWIAATTVASNLMRNFRSYGAVLAGYTAAIVALGSYTHPERVFETAIARGSATIIGIACSALVTSLLAPHKTYGKTMARLQNAIGWMGRRAALPAATPLQEKIALGGSLIAELIALDAEIDFAAAEAGEFRARTGTARSLLAHLFGGIAAKRSMDDRLARAEPLRHGQVRQVLAESVEVFEKIATLLEQNRGNELARKLADLRQAVPRIVPEDEAGDRETLVSERVILDRLDDLLRHLDDGIADWLALHGPWKPSVALRLNFHRDHRAAVINGIRAFLAVAAAGTFWIASAWSSGPGMVIQTGVACSLFSAAPRPDRAGISFLIGALMSLPAAFICNFYVLQNITGFPLFALVLGLFLVPPAMFFLNPKTMGMSLAACVVFFAISRPLNPMDYDIVSFMNNAISAIAGVAFGVMAYRLFFPPNPPVARCYVVNRIRLGLGRLSWRQPLPSPSVWQTRMFDRVNRLHDPANLSGTPTDEWLEGGLSSIELGNEILRLRMLLRDEPVPASDQALAHSVLHAFGRWQADPQRVGETVRAARQHLQSEPLSTASETRLTRVRMLGIFEEMEAFFLNHPRFLTPSLRGESRIQPRP